jgi:hypothetical protein
MNTQVTALLPMQPMPSLPTWLLMAAQVYAPQQVVLVGAGNGTGPLVQGLLTVQGMPQHAGMKAHALEAHAPTLAQLAKRLGPDSTWQLSADVVISPHGEANPTYHHYSLGTESSLLPPSELQTLWPSLQLMGEQPASSGVPINNLLTSLLPSPWLLLDCLPAAYLLHGADLSHTHVLLARVVLGAPDASPSGSTFAELQAQLAPQGYQLAACFAERNSQLAKTLWLRDPAWLQQQAKAKADQALSEQSKAHEAQTKSRAQELQALQTANDEAKQAISQLQAKLAAEVQAKQDLQAQNVQDLAQAAELTQANEQSQTQLKAAQAELQQAKAQAEQLAQAHAQQLEKERAQAAQALSEQSKAHEAQAKGTAQELQALQTANDEAKQANEQLQAKHAAEAQAKQDLQAQLQATEAQKNARDQENAALLEQVKKIDLAVTDQTQIALQLAKIEKDAQESEKRFKSELAKGLTNAVKQLESYMAIQQWADSGSAAFDFHGWPISPDLGLFLIDKINTRGYDLIIEFGSGTSTALIAKAVSKRAQLQDAIRSTQILSFEHKLNYFEKTQQTLKQHGFDSSVQLTYAPLAAWKEGEAEYLYYDCQDTLEALRQQHSNATLNVLLVIDGPPGATCPNARYPAVPFVFEALGRHCIDLVLDDASRPEEKAVIDMWRTYWKKRAMPISEMEVPSEKGIYFASVNS